MRIAQRLLQGGQQFPDDSLAFFQAHLRPEGRPWSFDRHEYLRAIIQDPAPHRVLQKAAQVAATTLSLGTGIAWCLQGNKVGYYLNDRAFLAPFIQDRLDPLINADPAIAAVTGGGDDAQLDAGAARARRKGADNLRVKHIGRGSFWFQGLQSTKDVKSVDLDAFILDEVDEVDQNLAVWLRDRLLHSSFRRRIELSQPSVPDYGINERFELSDQKSWQHRCPRCRRWHILEEEFPACLQHHARADEWRIVCIHCGARLRGGTSEPLTEWVPAHPEREVSGYRISQVYGPAMPPAELHALWAQSQAKRSLLENFTISVLGMPFAGDKQPLTGAVLDRASGDWRTGLDPFLARFRGPRPLVLGGADIGDTIHAVLGVVLDGVICVADLGVFSDTTRGGRELTAWEQLRHFLAPADFFLIDAGPERSQARTTLRTPGLTGAMCEFIGSELAANYHEKSGGAPLRVVRQDRNTAIDDMASDIRNLKLLLPAQTSEHMPLLRRHCSKLVKDLNPNNGRREYKTGVENHLGLALTYLVLARDAAPLYGLGPAAPLGDLSTWTGGGAIATGTGETDAW